MKLTLIYILSSCIINLLTFKVMMLKIYQQKFSYWFTYNSHGIMDMIFFF